MRKIFENKQQSTLIKICLIAGLFGSQVQAKSHFAGGKTVKRARAADTSKLQGTELSTPLTDRLNKMVASSGLNKNDLGLWVGAKTHDGLATVFAHNSDTLLIPASLSKVITAGAILSKLQPTHKFKTQLLSQVSLSQGETSRSVLKGSLYLKGGGDPGFVSENMWVLVNDLTRTGVRTIEGDVVVDDTRFDKVRFGEDRESVRVDRAYDAPIGAMSFNWNSVNVYIRPGEKVGDPLQVTADPTNSYIKLKNETKTVAAGRGKNVDVERITEKDQDVIRVQGSMALGHEEVVVYKSISQPDLWAGANLVEFLKQRGIQVKGSVKTGKTPADAKILASVDSKPLSLLVADMAKFSNNYVAEMLIKNLAAEGRANTDQPASMNDGLHEAQMFLDGLGFKDSGYRFTNASGFTRDNKFSARQLGRFLELMHGNFTLYPEFLMALPIAGVDGTLKSRMKNSAAENWVRAKTGLLNGVVGLAGYAGHQDGSIVTFAFLYNSGGSEDKARHFFDELAAAIADEPNGLESNK